MLYSGVDEVAAVLYMYIIDDDFSNLLFCTLYYSCIAHLQQSLYRAVLKYVRRIMSKPSKDSSVLLFSVCYYVRQFFTCHSIYVLKGTVFMWFI